MTKRINSFLINITILLTVIIALVALNLSGIGKRKTWDVEIPMANAHVNWEQTFYKAP